jgi:hypothetical protein
MCCLPAFLVQPDQPAGALRLQVFDAHLERGADAGEAVGEGGDQRPVAQVAHGVGRNGADQPPPFLAVEHRQEERASLTTNALVQFQWSGTI